MRHYYLFIYDISCPKRQAKTLTFAYNNPATSAKKNSKPNWNTFINTANRPFTATSNPLPNTSPT